MGAWSLAAAYNIVKLSLVMFGIDFGFTKWVHLVANTAKFYVTLKYKNNQQLKPKYYVHFKKINK